jgi:hypothetical protein
MPDKKSAPFQLEEATIAGRRMIAPRGFARHSRRRSSQDNRDVTQNDTPDRTAGNYLDKRPP